MSAVLLNQLPMSSPSWDKFVGSCSQGAEHQYDITSVISLVWSRVFSNRKRGTAEPLKQWDDSEIRYRAAKLCCENDPSLLCEDDPLTLSQNIKKFSLLPHQVFSLLSLLAEREPNMVISRIQTFDLSLEQRYAIAEICSKAAPDALLTMIEAFRLESKELSQIAMQLLDAPVDYLMMNIQKFESIPSDIRFEMAKRCALHDPYTTGLDIKKFGLTIRERFGVAQLCAEQSPYAFITQIQNFELETDEFWLKEFQILDHLRAPELKESLLGSVLACAVDEKMKGTYDLLIKGLHHPNYYAMHPEFRIICMMIAKCESLGIQLDAIALRNSFYGFVGKDSTKLKQLIFVFAKILTSDNLCLKSKENILSRLLMSPKEKFENVLQDMRILCNLGRYEALSSNLPLSDCVRLAVRDLFPDDFQGRVYSLFNDTRILSPHIILAAQLMTLNESEHLERFQECIASICSGTYLEERYSPSTNPHLQKLNAYDANILDLWRRPVQTNTDPKWVFTDTDHPVDLLLFGTDISTCQNIQIGDPKWNRGVVGTMMNGQTRMLCVKNSPDGRIVARAMIRLLWDGDQPVLFLDRFYGNQEFEPIIRSLAIEKAKEMGLILTEKSDDSQDPQYEKSLYSLGGRACEYCDGSRDGISEDGSFEISDVSLINQ